MTAKLPTDKKRKPEAAAGPEAGQSVKKFSDKSNFGLEGTNKTVPEPQPDKQASDELDALTGRSIVKSPHTAGNI